MEQQSEQVQSDTPQEGPFAAALRREIAWESGEPQEDSPAPEQEATEGEQAPEEQAEATEDAEAQPEVAEVEYEGETFQVPAKLKDAVLRQSDYTRKTQEVARERDSVQREREAVQQAAEAVKHLWPVIGDLTATQRYLNQLQGVNWQELANNDPIEHNRLRLEAIEAQNRLGHLAQQVNRFSDEMNRMQAAAIAEQTQRNLPKALELVPDLPKRRDEFVATGKAYGFQETELSTITDPRMIAALRDLAEFKKLTANRSTLRDKVANAPQVVARPGSKKVPTPNVDLKKAMHALRGDNSDDAFVAALRAQRKGR